MREASRMANTIQTIAGSHDQQVSQQAYTAQYREDRLTVNTASP